MRRNLLLLLCVVMPGMLWAQGFSSFNGRNHPELNWQVAETEHFEIMYSERLAGIEAHAAPIAEASYRALAANLDTEFGERIRIYLSDEDEISNGFAVPIGNGFTNIWVNVNDYADTWTGDVKWLRKVLAHELAHIFHYRAVKGNMGALAFILGDPVPSFWTEGLAQYQTEVWDSQRGDRWLRRAVFDDALSYEDGQSIINGRLKYAVGNSQLRYFTQTYGDSTLSKLLDHRKRFIGLKHHDFYDAFEEVTGESYRSFYDSWRKHVNIYYNTLAGQMQRTDSLGVKPTPFAGQFVYDAAVSPDGSQYAVLSLTSMKRPVRRLYLTQNDSTRKTRMLAEGSINEDIAWSPDGRLVAYSRKSRGTNGSIVNDIYLYDLEKNREKRLTDSRKARYPAFGPDSRQLAYVVNEGGTANIYVRNLQEGTEERLTDYGDDVQLLHLAWNRPRGVLLFHRFDAAGNRGLISLDLESGAETILDSAGTDNRMPVVSSDGRKVAYTSLRDEVPNVFIYDFEDETHRRVTYQVTGAEAFGWLPPSDSLAYGRLLVKASEKKNADFLYLVPDTVRVEAPDSVIVPQEYASWRRQQPPHTLPDTIGEDASLITGRYDYRSFANLTHVYSFALPYWQGPGSYGLFGATSWTEPLGKHTIAGGGNLSFADVTEDSYGVLTYINRQMHPTLAFSAFRVSGAGQFYGSEYLFDELTGGSIKASWPVDWFDIPYRRDRFSVRLRHVLVEPTEGIELYDENPAGIPDPEKARQTDLELMWVSKKRRPYVHNMVHPLDGYGLRLMVSGSAKVLGSETKFVTPDVSAYTMLPSLGLHRIYLYGRLQAQFGEPLPQDYIGFSRYSNVVWPLPDGELTIPYAKQERVRGYKSFVSGKQVAFASAEYRMPLLPSLNTKILGLVEFNATTLALFSDAGVVWDVQVPQGADTEQRWGAGAEVKNGVQLGPVEFVHSLGIAQPAEKLFAGNPYDFYYQIKASVAF